MTTATTGFELSGQRALLFRKLIRQRSPRDLRIAPQRRDVQAPLSFQQERLWFLHQLDPASSAYNIAAPFRLRGKLNSDQVERCLRAIRKRHEILRTTFPAVDGSPVQKILSDSELEPVLTTADLRELPEAAREQAARKRITEDAELPFCLSRGPLIRATLLRIRDEEYVGQITMHHIVSDGWSLGVFFQELGMLAGGTGLLPPLSLQYAEFAMWQRERLRGDYLNRLLDYWKRKLEGAPTLLELPTYRVRQPSVNPGAGREFLLVGPEWARQLHNLSEREGATLFMTLLTALGVLLGRYSGQRDLLVGTPIANRGRSELEPLIGLFMNVLPIRIRLDGEPSFRELLGQVRESALEAYAHQEMPFEKLVEALQPHRSPGQSPLVQAVFVMQNTRAETLRLPGMELEPLEAGALTAKNDLTVFADETAQGISLAFEYDAGVFDRRSIRQMADGFAALLEASAGDPEAKVSELPVLGRGDRSRIVREWNRTDAESPSVPMHALFAEQALRTPDSVAVTFQGQEYTYSELDCRANLLANYLLGRGAGPEVLVGVCMDRSLDMLTALLAVLKSGAAYVPLDPGYPSGRIAMVLEDAQAPLLLTQQHLLSSLPPTQASVIAVDSEWSDIERCDCRSPQSAVKPDNLAYVIFTSGSTGRPKGVQVLHRGLVNFLQSMTIRPRIAPQDVLAAVTTLSFDIAGLELFLPLVVGARIVIVDRATAIDGTALANELCSCRATVVQATPATWRLLIESGWKGDSSLKLLCGGEALPGDLAEELLNRCGELWNMYGPTETTIWSTLFPVTAPFRTPLSIGRPIANTQVYILDGALEPVPSRVTGELYIGGEGVARGYLNREDMTADRFVPDPFGHPGARVYRTGDLARFRSDGSIEFLGRADYQVKIRGFRIELGEIEEALSRHSGVLRAAVTTVENSGDKFLAAYLVLSESAPQNDADLRTFLKSRLPDYMIPAVFVRLDKMPLTPNGKVDRRALPAVSMATPESGVNFEPPRPGLEQSIAQVFERVLQASGVGRNDSFFDLGGHSLLIARTQILLRDELGFDMQVRTLFESPTVAGLAAAIEGNRRKPISVNFDAEAVLDPEIRPSWSVETPDVPGRVLLTGASGFLGAYLLHELLERTEASVVCLVRARSSAEAIGRIHDSFRKYGLSGRYIDGRVNVIPGDLSKPLLGLDPVEFEGLAQNIDVIYHNGAEVNFFQPYENLKASNVLGTQEVLRLASRGRRKPIHYVSTVSVLEDRTSSRPIFYENETPGEAPLQAGGYPQSKWVAEKLLNIAKDRGFSVWIYRPGTITGDSRTGACNENDFLYRFLRGCAEMERFPEIDMKVDLLPVDYVSAAIISISLRPESAGHVFHLVSPDPVPMGQISEWMGSFGFAATRTPYSQWRERLNELTGNSDHPLAPLTTFFPPAADDRFEVPRSEFDCTNTLAALEGTGIHCPEASGALMRIYTRNLIARGLIRPPSCGIEVAL